MMACHLVGCFKIPKYTFPATLLGFADRILTDRKVAWTSKIRNPWLWLEPQKNGIRGFCPLGSPQQKVQLLWSLLQR